MILSFPIQKQADRIMARQNHGELNAETQRNAEKRREEELSAILCGSLRLCVKSSQQSIHNYPSLRSLRSLRLTQLPFPI